jgi:hypothetical protein
LNGQPDPTDLHRAEQTDASQSPTGSLRAELDQILALPLRDRRAHEIIFRFFDSPLGHALLPEVAALHQIPYQPGFQESLWEHTLNTMLGILPPADNEEVALLDLRWTALLHEVGLATFHDQEGPVPDHMDIVEETIRVAATALGRLKFSNRRQRRILRLIHHMDFNFSLTERAMRRLVDNSIPLEGLFRLLRAKQEAHPALASLERKKIGDEYRRAMCRCRGVRATLKQVSPHDLALSGADIIDMVRYRPGPWLGELQRQMVDWVTEDPKRNRPELLERVVKDWIIAKEVF